MRVRDKKELKEETPSLAREYHDHQLEQNEGVGAGWEGKKQLNLGYFEFEMSMGHAGGKSYTELDTSQMISYRCIGESWTEHAQ